MQKDVHLCLYFTGRNLHSSSRNLVIFVFYGLSLNDISLSKGFDNEILGGIDIFFY